MGSTLNDRLSRDELSRTLAAICALNDARIELGLEHALPRLLAIAAEGTQSDASCAYLLDDEGAELVLAGSHPDGSAPGRGALRGPMRTPVAGTLLGEVAHGECARASGSEAGFGEHELALCPLLVHGRRAGVLVLARSRPYGERELASATVISRHLASQLETMRMRSEASRRVNDFSLMNELGELISGQRELPEILTAGVQQLARIVDVPNAFLLLLDESGTLLRTAASIVEGTRGPDVAIPLDAPSAATTAFHDRKPVVIRDPMQHALAHRELARRQGHREVVAVPLVARGEALGAVVLGINDDRRRFTRDEVDRTVAVANQLAAAIASARIYHEERQRVRDLSLLSAVARAVAGTLDRDVLLSECLARICGVLRFDLGAAHVLDRETGEFIVCFPSTTRGAPAGVAQMRLPGLVERAALRAAPVIEQHEDAEGTLHACALPLLTSGGAVGVVSVGRRHKAISEAEASTLAAVAPEIAVGLENCRLFAEARVRVDELRLFLDVGRAVTASLDLHDILETSAGILTRMIDASNSFILLLDPRKKTLVGVATSNREHRDAFQAVRIPLAATSLAARCVRNRSPIAVTDARGSTEVNKDLVALYGEKSLLALPMMVRDEPIGAVVIDDTRAVRHWRSPEIERAEVIAHQIAVAVSNARLFDDLKRSYGDLALAQEELVKRERLAALGELAAIMAHEVRNPVTVIFNSLTEMHKILRPTGDAAMLLSIVREEADRLNHLVGDLLEFAKPKQPAMQPESLQTVLEGAVEAATSEPAGGKVAVRTELAKDMPLVQIDARMMRRAFVNLVLNGIQAMSAGGTLTVRAGTERLDGRSIARVDVIDTGPGIEPDVAPRMFQPFFTTKASGTGLGLAVVKSIVDAHRGELSVQSHPGAGTTFTVRLPLEREPAQ